MLNKNELILDRVRRLVVSEIDTHNTLYQLTSLEDPTLTCTAEGEEVTDAMGSLITTIYDAKKATFSATNSLLSLDLAAAQYGATKEIADTGTEFTTSTYEVIKVASGATSVTLKHEPEDASKITKIFSIENGELGTSYVAGATASATEFVVSEKGVITLPTEFTASSLFVEYDYKTANAVRIVNKTDEFPEACTVRVYVYFKDKCNENKVYSGVIICPRAKLNPEQIELALTSTGKHSFEFDMMKDYCAEDEELFTIIVSDDGDDKDAA